MISVEAADKPGVVSSYAGLAGVSIDVRVAAPQLFDVGYLV
ncbi:hypothetical protein [Nitrobacter sp.]